MMYIYLNIACDVTNSLKKIEKQKKCGLASIIIIKNHYHYKNDKIKLFYLNKLHTSPQIIYRIEYLKKKQRKRTQIWT